MLNPAVLDQYRAWWSCRNERPLIYASAWDGAPPPPAAASPEEHWLDFPKRIARESYQIHHTLHFGASVPVLFLNFGPGVLGACMGGSYRYDWHTFWFDRPVLERLDDMENFRIREDNVWWQRVQEYTEIALTHAEGRFLVSITDIGGVMDIVAGLVGSERLLLALVEEPEAVKRAMAVVHEEWWRMYDTLAAVLNRHQPVMSSWNGIPADGLTYTLQNDFSCMISPAHFREFDLPFLREMCARLDAPLYHLDGPGAVQQTQALLELPDLRAIQWIPGAGAPGGGWPPERGGMLVWLDLLKQIRCGGKALEINVHADDVETLVYELGPEGLLLKVVGLDTEGAQRLAERWM